MNSAVINRLTQNAQAKRQMYRDRLLKLTVSLNFALLSAAAHAGNAAANIDLTSIQGILQDVLDFMAGPFGKAVVAISIVVAFATWVFAPRDGIFFPVLRVVVAGIAILNAAVYVAAFGAGASIQL